MTLYQWFTVLGLPTISGLIIKMIGNQIRSRIEDKRERELVEARQKETNRVILRMLIRQYGEKYVKREWASYDEKEDFNQLCAEHHNNGGNGAMDTLQEAVNALPLAPKEGVKS